MALKTARLKLDTGRDAGKEFLITEMPAAHADNWAMRALFALANGGVDLGFDPRMGMAAMAGFALSALGKVDPSVGIPLLNELLDCVQIIPSGGQPRALEIGLGDVEDFTTMWKLRKEVFTLHTDFLQSVLGQISDTSTAQVEQSNTQTQPT